MKQTKNAHRDKEQPAEAERLKLKRDTRKIKAKQIIRHSKKQNNNKKSHANTTKLIKHNREVENTAIINLAIPELIKKIQII